MATMIDERANPKLAEVVRRLVERFQPDRIYRFGSRARGDATEDSDYDLLMVVPSSNKSVVEQMVEARMAVSHIKLPTEIIVFTRDRFERHAPVVASLAASVVREGKLLYAAD
jgi:uncharacterized protein